MRYLLPLVVLLASVPALAAAPDVPLGTVPFPSRGRTLSKEAKTTLSMIAEKMKSDDLDRVTLIGHTDLAGPASSNMRLGLGRARAVRQHLVSLGVPAERIVVDSAGETEPVVNARTRAANDANRRVEIVIRRSKKVAPTPTAWVSWIHREVQTRDHDVQDWSAAQVNMPLDVMYRVRTLPDSAGEVTFATLDRLRLGAESLVVIYQEKDKTKRRRLRLSRVSLVEGTLFAQLAEPSRRLLVESPAAQIQVRSKDTRIAYDEASKSNTVAVFDGRAKVSSLGRSVKVKQGFGTRVKKGRAPEKPTPLPPAPAWRDTDALLSAGAGTSLAWVGNAKHDSVVEITTAKDSSRVLSSVTTSSASAVLPPLDVGRYHVRLRARDGRGIVGPAGTTRTLFVTRSKTASITATAEGLSTTLAMPGVLTLDLPEDVTIEAPVGRQDGRTWIVELDAPGRRTIGYRLRGPDGASVAQTLEVFVETPRVTVEVASPRRDGIASITDLSFMVRDHDGRPIPGLDLWIARQAERVETTSIAVGAQSLELIAAPKSSDRPLVAKELGDGLYQVRWSHDAVPERAVAHVSMSLPEMGLGAVTIVPLAVRPEAKVVVDPVTPPSAVRFGLAIRMGVRADSFDDLALAGHVDYGARIPLTDNIFLSGGAELGWIRQQIVQDDLRGRLDLVPIHARGAIDFEPGALRITLGASGGLVMPFGDLRFGQTTVELDEVQPSWRAFAAAGLAFEDGELFLEGGYTNLLLNGTTDVRDRGFALMLGYRVIAFD